MPLPVPRGIRNNNPGNLRRTKDKWEGLAKEQPDRTFFTFTSPIYGIRALARTLIVYQDKHRLRTIRQIITRWAPMDENDTMTYIATVADLSGIDASIEIDLREWENMRPLVEAMIIQENGEQPYSEGEIERGIMLAGVAPPVRTLGKSRTVKGGQIATVGVGASGAASLLDFFSDHTADLWDMLYPWLPYIKGASIGFLVLAVGGIGLMLWARLDDNRKGLR